MAALAKRTLEVARHIAKLRAAERQERVGWKRKARWLWRWCWMLYHEVLRDNVKIRAEGLAYLSLLSVLPVLAGCFFIFTVLTQFGMVQDALQGLLNSFLSTIPDEHRSFVHDYILSFQASYLSNIQQKSGTIGIFALLILAYVGLQAFANIEQTLNDIWGSDIQRPFLEKARNFIVISVVAPVTLIAGFSIPIILHKTPITAFVLNRVPILNVLLNFLIPVSLLFATFIAMYRFVPVVRVGWRAAVCGALFSTISLEITTFLLKLYFSFATNSAYGKLGSIPLVAFWLFVVWMVVILGAEVTFLVENESDILARADEMPTVNEMKGLGAVLTCLYGHFKSNGGPIDWSLLQEQSGVGSEGLRKIVDHLSKKGWIAEVRTRGTDPKAYLPARDLADIRISQALTDFLQAQPHPEKNAWSREWDRSLQTWLKHFGELTVRDLAAAKAGTSNQKEK